MMRNHNHVMVFEVGETFHAERLLKDAVLDRATDIILTSNASRVFQSVHEAHGCTVNGIYDEAYRISDTGSLNIRVKSKSGRDYGLEVSA